MENILALIESIDRDIQKLRRMVTSIDVNAVPAYSRSHDPVEIERKILLLLSDGRIMTRKRITEKTKNSKVTRSCVTTILDSMVASGTLVMHVSGERGRPCSSYSIK